MFIAHRKPKEIFCSRDLYLCERKKERKKKQRNIIIIIIIRRRRRRRRRRSSWSWILSRSMLAEERTKTATCYGKTKIRNKRRCFAHEISIFEERNKERKSKGILILLLSAEEEEDEEEEDRASSGILSLLMVAEVQQPQSTATAFIPYKRFQDKGGKERKNEIVTEKLSRQLRADLKAAAATTTTGSSKEKKKKKQNSTNKTKQRGK